MARRQKAKRPKPKTVLRLPDLEQWKNAVLNSLAAASSPGIVWARNRRVYRLVLLRTTLGIQPDCGASLPIFPGTEEPCSRNDQRAPGGSAEARLRSLRHRHIELRTRSRYPPGQRGKALGRQDRQLVDDRPSQDLARSLIGGSRPGKARSGDSGCAGWLWVAAGRAGRPQGGGLPDPGGALGCRRPDRQGKAHAHGSGSGLGEASHRRVDRVGGNQWGDNFPASKPDGQSLGRWHHAESDLAYCERCCATRWYQEPRPPRFPPQLREVVPLGGWRTGTNPVPARPRDGSNDRALPGPQAETSARGERQPRP